MIHVQMLKRKLGTLSVLVSKHLVLRSAINNSQRNAINVVVLHLMKLKMFFYLLMFSSFFIEVKSSSFSMFPSV